MDEEVEEPEDEPGFADLGPDSRAATDADYVELTLPGFPEPPEEIDWDAFLRPDPRTLQRMMSRKPDGTAKRSSGKRLTPMLGEPGFEIKLAELMVRLGLVAKTGPHRTRGKASISYLSRMAKIDYRTAQHLLRYPDLIEGMTFPVMARICQALNCTLDDWLVFRKTTRLAQWAAKAGPRRARRRRPSEQVTLIG